MLRDVHPNTNVDTLPRESFGRVRAVMREQGISTRRLSALRGTSYGGASHFSFAPSRATVAEYADLLNDEQLRDLATSDLFWDKVVSVEPTGEDDVF
jgi:replicative DNA helicase